MKERRTTEEGRWEPRVAGERGDREGQIDKRGETEQNYKKNMFIFPFWTHKMLIFDLNIGFLVKNCIYSLIPRTKLANPGQNLKKIIFDVFFY